MEQFDLTIIGGGPGGYVAAIRAAQLGARVALIEKDRLGGTCLNRGCIPTKALLRSIEVLREARRAAEFGVQISEPGIDFPKMMARKRQVVDQLVGGVEQLLAAHKVTIIKGKGSILRPGLIRITAADGAVREVTSPKTIIASGSIPAPLPIPGAVLPGVITSDEVLELETIPRRMVIIGGGVIGIEIANIFRPLGSEVTIVEMLPMILPPVDEELAQRYHQLLRRAGVTIYLNSPVQRIEEGEAQSREPKVVFKTPTGEGTVKGEVVLLATGRIPYTDGLGLSELGLKMDRRSIGINEYLQTSLEDIYAIGDVTGGMLLAHVASYQGEIAAENALGRRRKADYRAVPNCIFSHPEIAGVGMTERQIKEAGVPYRVSKFPFSANGRALSMGETMGLVKLLCAEPGGEVLGVHLMGPGATELIAEATLAVQQRATAEDIVHTIHAHPTLSEALREAALGQLDGPIHYYRG
ncbi:MAG: dihydrolipoyl dehydrogenase [Chloroflexi bacterium]|nr:dihydrolipoyl dehydrogenase [Chloroflexota bacterium]MCL5075148.1 dihydrolipoyl dehydrogenase [Chloroflexota bacterium]